jgi:hypothetical protein
MHGNEVFQCLRNAKMGAKQYPVGTNASPVLIDYLNEPPIKTSVGRRSLCHLGSWHRSHVLAFGG